MILFSSAVSKEWAQKALSSNSIFGIGYCHFMGLGVPANLEKAFQFLEVAANQGDEIAQFFFASSFNVWSGLEVDEPEKEFYWNLKSAEQGFGEALNCAGQALITGFGCEMNKEKGLSLLKKAANQGNAGAKDMLFRIQNRLEK